MHNLRNLPNDVKKFGNLSNFNCFKFESFMYKLKQSVKNGANPLAQIIYANLKFLKYVQRKSSEVTYSFMSNITNNCKLVGKSNFK